MRSWQLPAKLLRGSFAEELHFKLHQTREMRQQARGIGWDMLRLTFLT